MMIASATIADVSALIGATVALLGALGTFAWRLSQALSQFRVEHRALMSDLKARTEQLEGATPGITTLPESAAVKAARNGP